MFELEANINAWTDLLRAQGSCTENDLIELENHLRDEIEDLTAIGLASDEAFLISVKRLGNVNSLASEYAKINVDNLWKYLIIPTPAKTINRKLLILLVIFSLFSGTLFKIPEIFGSSFDFMYHFKNISTFILPFVALYFIIKKNIPRNQAVLILAVYLVSAVLINLYPSYNPNHTELLTAIHLPFFLWLITGLAYTYPNFRDSKERMNFLRFTGESFIYGVLITCGVFVLCVFTIGIFSALNIDLEQFVFDYILIYAMCGAVMITIYLAEAKKSIVENFAPVLAKIFSPLFLTILIIFLFALIFSGRSLLVDRNILIGFDLMLVLVLGLVIYVISARNMHQKKNIFDYLIFTLIITALLIDIFALIAILIRLNNFGISPNKVAALGENLVLLVNLALLSWNYLKYLRDKSPFTVIEKCQTDYLAVYLVWMGIVAFLFPVIFWFK